MEVNCETCSKIFKRPKLHVKRGKHHFCSRECHIKKELETKRERNCSSCGEIIDHEKHQINSRNKCNKCYKKEYRQARKDIHANKIRAERRIKRGLSIDHPDLKNKPFEGSITREGYRIICKHGHPNANKKNGKILEHQFIMSEYLGRPLIKPENIHHKNGIRDDNRIENLELWHKAHPAGQRVEDKIKFYIEFLEQYGYKVSKE